MALGDLHSNLHLFLRWLHVIAGIVWIGHLYFFNFVNIQLQGVLDDAGKKAVNPKLMPRALWWFRWGAMITFLACLSLYLINYIHTPGAGFGPTSLAMDPSGAMTARHLWILFGMLFATIMWFNVWFIIWPAQKQILGGKAAGDALAALRKRAATTSRINTYLSGPMLFGMLAPAHYGAVSGVTILVTVAVGLAAIWLAYRTSAVVGKSV
jgi:uncharacterized membrane protein